ncbi:MAG: hypothetical protein CEN90_618 [Parcubacteria group bacterium Licking1014_17]|nr:MAG: hypothetical protein CEN90_618 [Parcubacteria group bacterium Licking1014_17]
MSTSMKKRLLVVLALAGIAIWLATILTMPERPADHQGFAGIWVDISFSVCLCMLVCVLAGFAAVLGQAIECFFYQPSWGVVVGAGVVVLLILCSGVALTTALDPSRGFVIWLTSLTLGGFFTTIYFSQLCRERA